MGENDKKLHTDGSQVELPPELEKKIKEDPLGVLRNAKEFENKPYKDEALEKAFLSAAEKEPATLLARHSTNEVFPGGLAQGVDAPVPGRERAFDYMGMLEGKPFKEEIIEKTLRSASRSAPTSVFANSALLNGKSYQDEVLEEAFKNGARNDPASVISYSFLLDNKPYRDSVLEASFRSAEEKTPGTVFLNAHLLEGKSYKDEVIEKSARNLVDKSPEIIIGYSDLLNGKPYRDELMEKALRNGAVKASSAVLNHASLLDGKPYRDEVLKEAFDNAAVSHIRKSSNPREEAMLAPSSGNDGVYSVFEHADLLKGKSFRAEVLEKAFRTASEDDPSLVLRHRDMLRGTPYEDEVLQKSSKAIANSAPDLIFSHPEILEGKSYKNEIYEDAFRYSAVKAPASVIENAALLDGKSYKGEVLEKALRNAAESDPTEVLNHVPLLKGTPYENEVLEKASRNAAIMKPRAILAHPEVLEGKSYKDEVLGEAVRSAMDHDPRAVVEHGKLIESLPDGQELMKQAYLKIADQLTRPDDMVGAVPGMFGGGQTNIFSYAKLLQGKPYENEVMEKAFTAAADQSPVEVLRHAKLMEGKPYEEAVWKKIAADMPRNEGGIVRYLNEAHEEPDATRFAALKHFNASQEFDLLTYGRQDAYTSTYNGVLTDMLDKLAKDKKSLSDVLTPEQLERMPVFLEAAASYNRMDDVLKAIPQDKLTSVIHDMADKAGQASDLGYISTMSSMMIALKGNDQMRHLLEKEVRDHYDNAKTPEEKDKFGLLASSYAKNAESISPDMKTFFLGIAQNGKYKMPDVNVMTREGLVDKKTGTSYQLMVFSDDKNARINDGQESFEHWKATYKKEGWKIEDKGTYVEIESTGGKVPVKIFANKPDHHDDGLEAIKKQVEAEQKSKDPSFQVFIGRGHSYHAKEYIQQIDCNMNLIGLGSCGGYNNLEKVLDKSPDAQIIATQGTGTMYVNDPILLHINESINRDGTIDWSKEQKALDAINSDKKDSYMLPNKDLPFMMLRRYKELHPEYQPQRGGSLEPGMPPQDQHLPPPVPGPERDRHGLGLIILGQALDVTGPPSLPPMLPAGRQAGNSLTV